MNNGAAWRGLYPAGPYMYGGPAPGALSTGGRKDRQAEQVRALRAPSMTDKQLQTAVGKPTNYKPAARFVTTHGDTIGVVRHSSPEQYGRNANSANLARDDAGSFWHYHETNGRAHPTKSIRSAAIERAL